LCCIIIAVSLSFLGGGVVCAINLRFFDLALSRVLSRSRDVARFPGQWNHVRLQPLLCRERRSSSWSSNLNTIGYRLVVFATSVGFSDRSIVTKPRATHAGPRAAHAGTSCCPRLRGLERITGTVIGGPKRASSS
jgi:hypothetical protein